MQFWRECSVVMARNSLSFPLIIADCNVCCCVFISGGRWGILKGYVGLWKC